LRNESAKLSGATGLPWRSIGVTDNDWVAFLFKQPLLPKTALSQNR